MRIVWTKEALSDFENILAHYYLQAGAIIAEAIESRISSSLKRSWTLLDASVGDDLAQIFQRHYKGADSQGAGIGLSLVRRICERYGWEITIESRESVGTVAALVWAPV